VSDDEQADFSGVRSPAGPGMLMGGVAWAMVVVSVAVRTSFETTDDGAAKLLANRFPMDSAVAVAGLVVLAAVGDGCCCLLRLSL